MTAAMPPLVLRGVLVHPHQIPATAVAIVWHVERNSEGKDTTTVRFTRTVLGAKRAYRHLHSKDYPEYGWSLIQDHERASGKFAW